MVCVCACVNNSNAIEIYINTNCAHLAPHFGSFIDVSTNCILHNFRDWPHMQTRSRMQKCVKLIRMSSAVNGSGSDQ